MLNPDPYLTKSRYTAGLQCVRRLWNQVHDPLAREALAPGSAADVGTIVGRLARQLFPNGILVDAAPWEHAAAERRTAELLAQPDVPALFEAAFTYDNIRVRVDVLERLPGGGWGLREVKSATAVDDRILDDVAVQLYVLMGLRIAVESVEVLHLDDTYVRPGGEIDWRGLFRRQDVFEAAKGRLAAVGERVRTLFGILTTDSIPDAQPWRQCTRDVDCEFWARCTATKPKDWIIQLPRLRAAQRDALAAAGYEAIGAIPADWPLNATQHRVREVIASGKPFVSADLWKALRTFGPPTFYLDFETMRPAIPLYPGTRPYQQIPFQWSLHHLGAGGAVTHWAFLAEGRTDPRRALATSLIEAVGGSADPVLAYNAAFEAEVLRQLADHLPDLADTLRAIEDRLADPLKVVRDHVYLPAFEGSFSLKRVAPALVPAFGYSDLGAVANGGDASSLFPRIVMGTLAAEESEEALRAALLAYCARDTEALMVVHRRLQSLSAQPVTA